MDNTGNNSTTSGVLNTYIALKDNIMRTLKVCEVCRVISETSTNYYKIQILNKPDTYVEAYTGIGTLNENDIVIVIFTNYDTRKNLERALAGEYEQLVAIPESETKHSIDFGIIINKIN